MLLRLLVGSGGLANWHLPGASGSRGLGAPHSNPGPHSPQSKLALGLKHGPQSSPTPPPRGITVKFTSNSYAHNLNPTNWNL